MRLRFGPVTDAPRGARTKDACDGGIEENTCEDVGACRRRRRAGLWIGIGAADRAQHGPAGYLRDQHPPGRRSTRRPARRRAGDRRRRRGRSAGGYRRPLRHRHRHDHHRRLVDRHHRAGDRALARADAAGRAGARAGHPDAQPVRHGERRIDQRRLARLRRRRHLQHARADQRPPAQRHRHGRCRFQRDPEEQHRADRDHPRQFRRRALWRQRGRRRHQHRHQDRRRSAALGARAGGLRLLQLPGRQSVREHVRRTRPPGSSRPP